MNIYIYIFQNFKSTVNTFHVTDWFKEFSSSFSTLRTNKENRSTMRTTAATTTTALSLPAVRAESQLLLFFLRYVYALAQSGFVERAIATFQANIEFNLFRPEKYERAKGIGEPRYNGHAYNENLTLTQYFATEPGCGQRHSVSCARLCGFESG